MAVTYTMGQHKAAAADGLPLATIQVAGLCFQDTVSDDEQRELLQFYLAFTQRRADRLKAAKPEGGVT